MLRWSWGGAWQDWLRRWPGAVLHFPDYDPAGLRIFASEVLTRRPEAKLMIPQGFEAILEKQGSRKLYLQQEPLNVQLANDPRIKPVSMLRKFHRKALEQEELLYAMREARCDSQ